MFNYTAKDFLFVHNEVIPSLNSSKFFKKFKLEAVPFIGTLAGALTFCVAKKIDVDHCIKKDIKAGISYHGKFKGVNFERCNNYSGKYIICIDLKIILCCYYIKSYYNDIIHNTNTGNNQII